MAGSTHVTVHPTHRRRGILTEMMRRHLDQAAERGQPVAGLWASEERIYGRFGYGPATFGQQLSIADHAVAAPAPDPAVGVHPLTVDEAAGVLPPVYEANRTAVPGSIVRTSDWWTHRRLPDPVSRREGAGVKRYVVAERDGVAVGYLAFRLKQLESWGEGRTAIIELVAADDAVRRTLWHFALNVDLHRNVAWWNAPVDEPGVVEVDRFRKVERQAMDALWLRPLDVVAVLEARAYERDGVLVLGVDDRFGPAAGRYRLEAVGGVRQCQRTDDEPQVELAVENLGRLLLGGTSAVTLARAGLVAGDPTAIATLHDLFTTRRQPHCPEVF